jgi:hypothetical protein
MATAGLEKYDFMLSFSCVLCGLDDWMLGTNRVNV